MYALSYQFKSVGSRGGSRIWKRGVLCNKNGCECEKFAHAHFRSTTPTLMKQHPLKAGQSSDFRSVIIER